MTPAHYKLELLAAALRRAQEIFDMGEDYAWQARHPVKTATRLCRELEEILAGSFPPAEAHAPGAKPGHFSGGR